MSPHSQRLMVSVCCLLFVFGCFSHGAIQAESPPPAIAEKPEVPQAVPSVAISKPPSDDDELTPEQKQQIRILEIFTSAWFFVVGATIGSFLNVVVYRLPLGMSLGHPKSRCPGCETPIGRGDNLPIIGWLRLHGRCRSCGIGISPRYPTVETTVALAFFGLLHVELLTGGGNLPVRNPNTYAGVLWIIWYTKWDLIGLYAYHCFLLCGVLTLGLIHFDGQRLPRKFAGGMIAIAVLLSMNWPHLHPVPFQIPVPSKLESLRWSVTIRDVLLSGREHAILGISIRGFCDGLLGGVAGIGFGSVLQFLLQSRIGPVGQPHDRKAWELFWMFGFVGVILGWQALVSIVCLTSVPLLFLRLCGVDIFNIASLSIAGMTTIYVFLWRTLSEVPYWPSHRSSLMEMALATVISLGLFVIALRPSFAVETTAMQKPPE